MSFAAGFILGQATVLIVVAVVIRFFLFVDTPPAKLDPVRNLTTGEEQQGSDTLNSILERTYYNVETHQAESMDWFTVLLALTLSTVRTQALHNDNLLRQLSGVFASDKVPSFIDSITITELDLGSDFPLLNNCRVYRSNNTAFSNGLEAQLDIDFRDTITLAIETRLLLNYPRPFVAYLPIFGRVSLKNFSGRMALSLVTDETDGTSYATFMFSPNFSMEFNVNSLIGARSKLEDVPRIGQLVKDTLRKRFAEQCVAPNFAKIKIPGWEGAKKQNNEATSSTEVMPKTDKTVTSGYEQVYGPQLQQKLGERVTNIAARNS